MNVEFQARHDSLISLFDSKINATPSRTGTLGEALQGIGYGALDRDKIEALRAGNLAAKDHLQAFTFQGTFWPTRSLTTLSAPSGIMMLDFDKMEPQEIEELCDRLRQDSNILSFFRSSSGTGIRALLAIPFVKDDDEYKEYWYAINEVYPKIDKSCKDVSRISFVTYDPDIYVNTEVTVFNTRKKVTREAVAATKEFSGTGSHRKALELLTSKIMAAPNGHRHDTIRDTSIWAGGYVASGVITIEDAREVLERSAYAIDPDDFDTNQKAIDWGLEQGMQKPIYWEDRTPQFQQPVQQPFQVQQHYNESEIQSFYVPFEDYEDEIDDLILNGNPRGEPSSFSKGRQFISYRKQATTMIYSAPHSGKTQFAFSEMVHLAQYYGWKFAVYSVETGEPKHVFEEVAKIMLKTDSLKKMAQEQIQGCKDFFRKHFFVIDPLYRKSYDSVTIDIIFSVVDHIAATNHIDSVFIDPLSEIEAAQGDGDRIDRFISSVLRRIIRDARINNRHNFLVTHVRDQKPQMDKETGLTYFPVPTPREISGGQTPYRMGQQLICVYRPNSRIQDKESKELPMPNETQIFVQKSKPKGIGRLGMFKLFYQWETNTFYEDYHPEPESAISQQPLADIPQGNPSEAFSMDDPSVNEMF